MTARLRPKSAAWAGGRPLARVGALVLLAVALGGPAARAQTVTWEPLPLFPDRTQTQAYAVGFLRGEGPAAVDPAADTLVWIGAYGAFLYNPSGAAGAAGDNGAWGAWHRLQAGAPFAGLVTSGGTLFMGSAAGATRIARGTARGRVWALNYEDYGADPFFEATVPSAAGPGGEPAVLIGIGDGGQTARSFADGAPGSWAEVGTGMGYPQTFGEVPPSAALPAGRLLIGTWSGARFSDDGGLTYTLATGPGASGSIVWSFAFAPQAGHPYGGVVYAGIHNVVAAGEAAGAEVLRSDDGGATWTTAHRFTAAEMEVPVPAGTDVTEVRLLAAPDGALWAGVAQSTGATSPPHGGIMRSADGGATWSRADGGFRNASGWGHRVHQFALSRTGVLYAATYRGVWRTTGPVVAGEASPGVSSEVGVSVRPNPAGGRVEVAVTLAEAGPVRVVVVDALGREVAVVLDGEAPSGERVVGVDTSRWPGGVYVVRATAGASAASARLVVAR